MQLFTTGFRRSNLNFATLPTLRIAAFGTSATRNFGTSGISGARGEAYLRGLPATTPLLERIQLWWELLSVPYGNRPALTRVLLVNAEDEEQRSQLPLQSLTHPFFIAPLSETPLLLGMSLFGVLSGTVSYLHQGFMGLAAEPFLLLFLLATLRWCGYMEQLGANPALYSGAVRRNLLAGILLFIVSEVMIFFALFWALFHSALNPSPELGSVWPPLHLLMLEWSHWPTLNTALLVYSGGAANVGLYALQNLDQRLLLTGSLPAVAERLQELTQPRRVEVLLFGSRMQPQGGRLGQLRLQLHRVYGGFLYAVVCGALFLLCQLYEYGSAGYAMSDGVYGSVFYGLTGLHGLHVLVGLLLLLLVLYRLWQGFFDQDQNTHDGPTGGVWYWHFVDVVWLALFAVLYLWGNSRGEALLPLAECGALAVTTVGSTLTPATPLGGWSTTWDTKTNIPETANEAAAQLRRSHLRNSQSPQIFQNHSTHRP